MITIFGCVGECRGSDPPSSFSKGLPSYRFGHCTDKLLKTAKDMRLTSSSSHDALGLYICKTVSLRKRVNEGERPTFPKADDAMSTSDMMVSIPMLPYEMHLAYASKLSVRRVETNACEVRIYDGDATTTSKVIDEDFYETTVTRSLLDSCFRVEPHNQDDDSSTWTVISSTSERATVISSEGHLSFDRSRRFFHEEPNSSFGDLKRRAYKYVAQTFLGDNGGERLFEHITVDVVSPSRREMGRMKVVYFGERINDRTEPELRILAAGACSGVLFELQRLSETEAVAEVSSVGALRDCEIPGTVALNVGLLATRLLTKGMTTRVTLLDVARRRCVLNADSMQTASLKASPLNIVLTGSTLYGGFRGFKPDTTAILGGRGLRSHNKQHAARQAAQEHRRYDGALKTLAEAFGVGYEADVFTGIERLKAADVFSSTGQHVIDDALSTLSTSTETIDTHAPGSFRATMRYLSDCAFGRLSPSGASPLLEESSKCCLVLYDLIEIPNHTHSLMHLLWVVTSHAAAKEMIMRASTEDDGGRARGLYARMRAHK